MKKIVITAFVTLVAVYGYSQDGIHLPLTGGTLTGPLSGTTLTLSGGAALGTTTPGWGVFTKMLDLQGASLGGTSAMDFRILSNLYYDGGAYRLRANGPATQLITGGGQFDFFTIPSGNANDAVVNLHKFSLTHTNATINVPLIINSPGQSVKVRGQSTNSVRLQFQNDDTQNLGNGIIGLENSVGNDLIAGAPAYSMVLGTGSTRSLVLGTNSTTALTINASQNAIFTGSVTGTSAAFSGNMGIGTTNPEAGFKLEVNGLGTIGTSGSARIYMGTTDASNAFIQSRNSSINQNLKFYASEYKFDIGNVGIGANTLDPDAKLTVGGKIHSQEVKVTVSAGADFVFQKDYNLKPLAEVAGYISTNKHLPEIASADEMKKNGLELGEMNIKLLQKIEELTLYMIEQNKRSSEQDKLIQQLNKRVEELELKKK